MHPFFLFAAGAVTGYAVASSSASNTKKNRGYSGRLALPPGPQVLALGPSCSSWDIIDPPRADLLVRRAYIEGRLAGITDPHLLTDRVVRAVAPQCHTPHTGIRNIGELDLYTSFFDSILALLEDDFPDEDFEDVQIDFQQWHQQQAADLS